MYLIPPTCVDWWIISYPPLCRTIFGCTRNYVVSCLIQPASSGLLRSFTGQLTHPTWEKRVLRFITVTHVRYATHPPNSRPDRTSQPPAPGNTRPWERLPISRELFDVECTQRCRYLGRWCACDVGTHGTWVYRTWANMENQDTKHSYARSPALKALKLLTANFISNFISLHTANFINSCVPGPQLLRQVGKTTAVIRRRPGLCLIY